MDGSYDCELSSAWILKQGNFNFILSADNKEIVPIRTLTDPTTSVVSTQDTYERLAVLVAPIECTATHAHPDGEGARCVCEPGYYRRMAASGRYSCEHCDRGQEPVEGGTRCNLCVPGKFSAVGKSCDVCPPGNSPNLLSGADSCTPCDGHSVSHDGGRCAKCEADQVADPSRTSCICPAGLYNSSRYDGNTMQCVPKNLREGSRKAMSSCTSCDGLACVKCAAGLVVVPGWATTGSGSPWIVFRCPFRHACANNLRGSRCAVGHTGVLCAECEPGYGLTAEECVECKTTMQHWYVAGGFLVVMVTTSLVVYMWRKCKRDKSTPSGDELTAHLMDNPVQPYGSEQRLSPRGSLSDRVAERRSKVSLGVRVLYQPARILVGYIQVRTTALLHCGDYCCSHDIHTLRTLSLRR
jgi:hypothetical protein